jgi:hypothetical protein
MIKDIEKCFFCEKIIIPFKYVSMQEVLSFFKKNHMEYTLNHERSRRKIGNKIICFSCEEDIKEISKNTCMCKHENEEKEIGLE